MKKATALVLTYNERENIGRSLESLSFVSRVIVVDSGSTDETVAVVNEYRNAKVVHHPFTSFAAQCAFGQSLIETDWVLSLDADYIITPELRSELQELQEENTIHGYEAAFEYCVFGRPLRSSLYPPRIVLYRKKFGRYEDEGHGHRTIVDGNVKRLRGRIQHDDRKPLTRWIQSQNRYALVESRHLASCAMRDLKPQDILRRWIFPAPIMMFFYLLFVRGLVLDGWRGWFYVAQRVIAELMLSLRLLELRLGNPSQSDVAGQ